jgi:hypothetical protein
MVGLFEAPELQGNPNMTFLAVTQEYKLDIWKDQDLIYAILNGHTTGTRVQRLGEGPVVDDDLTDWEIALKEDYSALRRYKYDRNMVLEIFRLNRELFDLHLEEIEENVHENEFNEQYTSVQRPELYSLYAHIVYNGKDTPELSSEESSTEQTNND